MRLESRRLCAVVLGHSPFRRGRIRPSLAALLVLAGILVFGPAAMAQRRLFFDFDTTEPTEDDELPEYFDLYGFDNFFGPAPGWRIDQNNTNPDDDSNALHTTSDGNQLQAWFSRVAIFNEDVVEAEDVEISADLTWDLNGGDATDNAGLYVRFVGTSDDPFGNNFYHARIGGDNGPPSSVNLHRVRDGIDELLAREVNTPFPIVAGDTVRLMLRVEGEEIFVEIDEEPIPGMDPFVDPDPLLEAGRVGVGQETNPTFFDNIEIIDLDAPPEPEATVFHRGDANADGQTNLTDPVFILNFLFQGGPTPPCAETANANDDDSTNVSDSVYLLNFLFQGGAPPTAPGPPPMACGPDPDNSPNDLGCETYESC